MSAVPSRSGYITLEEYYRLEETSMIRHDYVGGRRVPVGCDPATYDPSNPDALLMAGGSPEHSLVIANIVREIGNGLKGKPCRVYDSNLRIGSADGFRHFPDATIVCGPLAIDPTDPTGHTIRNPTVAIEVLSPSTAGYDLGDKFDHYRAIETFREYVVVRQDRAEITTYLRHDDGSWTFRAFTGLAAEVPIRSVDITLAMSEVYDGIDFPPPPPFVAG